MRAENPRNFASGGLTVRQLRSRAPLRLGLAGGGTDLSSYSETYGGAVLNATIDRYAYTHMSFLDKRELRFRASDIGVEETLDPQPSLSIRGGRTTSCRGFHPRPTSKPGPFFESVSRRAPPSPN